jgi:hypothetical protein
MSSCTSARRRYLFALFLLLVGPVALVRAQDVTEVTLKGAFLFNFARFTEWPADALRADSTVSACVVGDRPVADAFSRTVKGKQLAGRTIAVTVIGPTESIPACHLLYLSGITESRLVEIVSAVRDVPVLTVSDSDVFTKRGGIVQIFVESGKMKFRINARSAKRARLQLSSRLLALAEVVDEDVASVAALPATDLITSTGPKPALPELEQSSHDRARRFVWGRH